MINNIFSLQRYNFFLNYANLFVYLQKKNTPKGALSSECLRSVLGIILLSADFPQVLRQGLATAGGVTLREERGVVLVDLHEVFTTESHCLAYRIEACPDEQLLCRRVGLTFPLLAKIDSRTLVVGGRSHTMGSEKHLVARMLTAFTGLSQCA